MIEWDLRIGYQFLTRVFGALFEGDTRLEYDANSQGQSMIKRIVYVSQARLDKPIKGRSH
jgi:hypothetical protein